jgi:hypothetical protein
VAESPHQGPHEGGARWQEWVITVSVVALSLLGVWTVFGDDLLQLFR